MGVLKSTQASPIKNGIDFDFAVALNNLVLRLRLAKVVKPTYRLHIGARVNAALLT